MTCQHCQTWVLDEDHRCRRCGRRLRSTPARVSAANYPIVATAAAPAYDFHLRDEAQSSFAPGFTEAKSMPTQQPLQFAMPFSDSRVISLDSSTADAARRSIQARAENSRTSGVSAFSKESSSVDTPRPAPLTVEKVQVRRARNRKPQPNQRHLELFGNEEILSQPESTIICDAPVAPIALRLQAGMLDILLMAAGCAIGAIVFRLCSGGFLPDKHVLPFVAVALITIPLFYRFLWAFAGLDSMGMRMVGLRLVDFDGNPPSPERRFHRIFGSALSVSAAGMGLIWSLVDQDRLSWHDHISSTFPTLISEG